MVPITVLDVAPPTKLTSRSPANKAGDDLIEAEANQAFAAVRLALEHFSAIRSEETSAAVRNACRTASALVARLSRRDARGPVAKAAACLAGEVTASGALGKPIESNELARVGAQATSGWPGLLAAMFLTSAWQSSVALRFEDVPDWLWGDYAAWVFAPPQNLASAADWERFSAGLIHHLAELNSWIGRNLGSPAVCAAANAYLRHAASLPRSWGGCHWRKYAELRGQLLTRFVARGHARYEPEIPPRLGRRLRVGFLQRDFGAGRATYAALPCFEHLDPQAFEILLFALAESDTAEAQHCARHAQSVQILPSDPDARVGLLRAEGLDVLVFDESLGTQFNEITRLALHRIAPLQIANDRTERTTGLPEIDLYVSGARGDAAVFADALTERLGLLRGPAQSFDFVWSVDAATSGCTREALKLPNDATLLATVVTPSGVSRETLAAWVDVLAGTQNSTLLVVFPAAPNANPSGFCATIDAMLAGRGVAADRVIVVAPAGATEEARRWLSVADAYLDALSDGEPLWVAQALLLGLPVVAVGGITAGGNEVSAGILRSIDLSELVADDPKHYTQLAMEIVVDTNRQANLRARIRAAVADRPEFLDAIAASDAFGALIETAFDELSALGRREFRAAREAVSCFCTDYLAEAVETGLAALERGDADSASVEANLALRTEPRSPQGRWLHGQVLLAQGNPSRAVDYLLAAVEQTAGKDARILFTLAQALRADNQAPQAVQTLELCLRLDGKHVEALLMLFELAEQCGGGDPAREVLRCLQQVAPDDPRVLAMS
jgi:predicted O-linked N-acetylglucosamine transferase (SPINDLY family)